MATTMRKVSSEEVGPYFEYKYLLPLQQLEEVRPALIQYLHVPTLYALGKTTSYYFDTDRLDEYNLGLSGYSRRQKLRYRILEGPDGQRAYFLEFKEKLNDLVYKKRQRLAADISSHLKEDLTATLLEMDKERALRMLGASRAPFFALAPKLIMEYTRRRYICPVSDARVNLDTNLFSTCVHEAPSRMGPKSYLAPYAVLEVKAPRDSNMPSFLNFLKLNRTAFSKYCFFMSRHLHDDAFALNQI